MITGIVIALADEIDSLTDQKLKKGDCISINASTLLICSGAGPENASAAAQTLISKGAERLISWGCAGALSAEMNPGDLILPKQLISASQQTLELNSTWFQYCLDSLSKLNPITASLQESQFIVAESKDKKNLHTVSNAAALDMESVAVAEIALQHKLPMLVIRCIADPVEMSLPKAVSHALNAEGEVVLSKLLRHLLFHPTEITALIKLGLHFKAAKNKLNLVARQLDIIVGFEQCSANQ